MSHPYGTQVRYQFTSTTNKPRLSFANAKPSRPGRAATTTRSLVWDRKSPYDSDVRTRVSGYLPWYVATPQLISRRFSSIVSPF
jgi:hypothetical protein